MVCEVATREERHLELTVRLNDEDFEIDIYEPETGMVTQLQHPVSFDEHPEFDKAIGAEIYKWLGLWYDEKTALGLV